MSQIRTVQTNFSSGELDPLMRMRVETNAWQNGAGELTNAALFNTGGVGRRPGTWDRGGLASRTRLIGFEFSGAERYVLGFRAGALDVFSVTGALLQTIAGCRWTLADLFELTYAQAADVMVVAHTHWPTQIVRRTGAATFTVADFAFEHSVNDQLIYQPYYKFADDGVTLACSATTGAVTLTASAPAFVPELVGTRLRWGKVEIAVTGFTDASHMDGTVLGVLAGTYGINPLRTYNGSGLVEVTHVDHGFATGETITLSGANNIGGITAAELTGDFVIEVLDDHRYTIATAGAATESIDGGGPNVKYASKVTATRDWAEASFSPAHGYPGACCFHEGRLWFGGSRDQPDGVWGSKIYGFFNFDTGEGLDNESIQITLGADEISNVRHLVSHRDLQIFSTTCEFYCPSPPSSALTPASIKVRRQTPYGASMVTPQLLDGATLFVQSTKTAVREYVFADQTDGYTATNLNILTGHLIDQPHDLAVLYGSLTRSEQYAFLVNADGSMAVLNSARSEGLTGWTRWRQEEGVFDAACVVGDEVYFSVLRHGAYRLEQLSTDRMHPLDGAMAMSGAPTTTWYLSAAYAGREVDVCSGTWYLGRFPVDGAGVLELPQPASEILVGYGYAFRIATLPVHVALATGPMTGRPKRVGRVIIGLDTTLSVAVAGNKLILRQVTDDMSEPPLPFTGSKEFFLLGYSRDAVVTVDQDQPLPCAVLGMALEVAF